MIKRLGETLAWGFGQTLGQGFATLERKLAQCLLCHSGQGVQNGICRPCREDLPVMTHACRRCAIPLNNPADRECPRCLQQPPPQAHSHACWYYAYPVAQLIQRFKYQRDFAAGRTLAEVAASQLAPQLKEGQRPDLLVPVPLHWKRQLSRGYNQAQMIAAIFGRQWQIPLVTGALRKVASTGSQQLLKRPQRLRNLSQSFRAHPQVQDRHIGLVDDVITTGATLEVATQTLLDAGATRVSCYALARTP